MKRFVIHIALLCLVCTVCLAPPLYYYEYLARQNTTMEPFCSINRVYSYSHDDADLIVMGNSRSMHYNTAILDSLLGLKCRNIGWAGHPFDFQYHGMFKTYMRYNKPPKYILQEITPQLFFSSDDTGFVLEMLPNIDKPEFQFYIDLCPNLSYADKFLLVRYAGKMEQVIKQIGELKEEKSVDFCSVFHPWQFEGKRPVEKDPQIISLFQHYLDECDSLGIRVVLLCSPFREEDAKKYLDMNAFWNQIDTITKGRDVNILNYQSYFGSDTTYFFDPAHLKPMAVAAYTRKVAHDLDSLCIIPHKK